MWDHAPDDEKNWGSDLSSHAQLIIPLTESEGYGCFQK